ncbi:MAG: NERD domain-containing protein [Oscillospiraceae bacterium]|nr:NERD domain-containing protein [Oscillospiraceae bacterium]
MGLWEIIKGEQPGLINSILHYENRGQFGEYSTEFALTNNNLDGDFVVLKNLYIPSAGKTTEIDLLMLHERGIFVFESKNYSGWIFGSADQLQWTQSLQGGQKNHFYNPIRQNQTHIKALAQYLGLPVEAFTSYIVFSERCDLKKVPEDTKAVVICRRPKMLKHLRYMLSAMPVKYSHADIVAMAGKLKALTEVSAEVKHQHIEDINTKCPFCGSTLVLRNGKYGAFWGCSSYPKCHFTRKVE